MNFKTIMLIKLVCMNAINIFFSESGACFSFAQISEIKTVR